MSRGSAKLPKPTPAKTTCSKLTLSFPQPLLSVSLPSLIRIGICLYTDLNQLFIDFLSQRKLNQIVEFYLDPPNQILYSDTIIKAIAELRRIEISIFNLWKQLPDLEIQQQAFKESSELEEDRTPPIFDIEDINGVENIPSESWKDWIQGDGCKRWWSSRELLDYHRRKSSSSNSACSTIPQGDKLF
jgi:hypothetical protein